MSADAPGGASAAAELPLFPLQTVLFPDGLLHLKVFEARYLDLMGRCLRSGGDFGVIGLRRGEEVRRGEASVELEAVGTRAEILEVDSPQSGILAVRCRGTRRFRTEAVRQQDDGLWVARVQALPDDEAVPPPPQMQATVDALVAALDTLRTRGAEPPPGDSRFDDAGWVANRWCEILPIPLGARQKLMALDDALTRLRLVDDFLRSKGVVG
jgi:Lon protease-like protein